MNNNNRRRFTIDEDRLLLANWWDPSRRERLAASMGRSMGSLSQRYRNILQHMQVNPREYGWKMRLREIASRPSPGNPTV
jgi:hypothetical protein